FPVRVLGRSPLHNLLVQSATANGHILVIVQMAGGNDGLNCVIPYNDPNYTSLRPTLGLKTSDNILPLPDHNSLALHFNMSGAHDLYSNKRMAILQGVGYPNPDLSHFRGTDIWNTSTDSNLYATTGWVGRFLYQLNPSYPPAQIPAGSAPLAIEFGAALSNVFLSKNGGMGIAINQLPTKANASTHNYDAIPSNPTTPYQELEYVRTIQQETEVYSATLLGRSVTSNKVTYPTDNPLGAQLSQVAQCIASGFSTKIYLVYQGGYDTHSNQLTDQAKNLQDLSDAFKAFQDDLEALGVADNVLTMTYSEFGRRPKENGSGTDHGTAAPLFVFGTQVNAGVYGNDPALDSASLTAGSGNLTFQSDHDFRNIYATMMYEWLLDGSDADKMTLVDNVLTASDGSTYSANTAWKHLGIVKQGTGSVSYSDAPGLMLLENYPNPVSASTSIEYVLPDAMAVQLGIFNTGGVEVDRIVDTREEAGPHYVTFNAKNLPSGNYLYRLQTPVGTITKSMVIVK
ncbi:MAG TPA: DUF1501 domain-containing protein, partial [Candidatus Kapabacteria bacterium]|nr:DUF1501 domain-containing protein [Candidatus Kapabacteria bacterium]